VLRRKKWQSLQHALWLLLVGFGVTRLLVARAADDWRTRWRTALTLYEQAKYDKACPLLQSVSKEQPKNAAVWADLAACEKERKGASSALALHALRMSIRWGDESTREKGYLALGAAGRRLALPKGCGSVSSPPEAACPRKASVCIKSWSDASSAYSSYGEVAFFGYTRDQAQARSDGFDPRVEGELSRVLSLNDYTDDMCGGACDRAVEQGAAADSPLIVKQAQACVQHRPGPFGSEEPCVWQGRRCGNEQDCRETVLKNAEKIAGIANEVQRFIGECVANCQASARPLGPECIVVHVDACRSIIGVVCTKRNADGSTQSTASEWGIPDPD
jgi:hypothetical protein